jgi:hypothetical protein
MNLLSENHIYKLRFRIDKDSPQEYINRWIFFKNKCESGHEENEQIVDQIKMFCKLEQNKKLSYLVCYEGGLFGLDKQIRFRRKCAAECIKRNNIDDDIIMGEIYDMGADTETNTKTETNTRPDKWTYEELDDLISAFIKVAEYYVNAKYCIKGCIEMTKQDR